MSGAYKKTVCKTSFLVHSYLVASGGVEPYEHRQGHSQGRARACSRATGRLLDRHAPFGV